jgi:hypothetical protein
LMDKDQRVKGGSGVARRRVSGDRRLKSLRLTRFVAMWKWGKGALIAER